MVINPDVEIQCPWKRNDGASAESRGIPHVNDPAQRGPTSTHRPTYQGPHHPEKTQMRCVEAKWIKWASHYSGVSSPMLAVTGTTYVSPRHNSILPFKQGSDLLSQKVYGWLSAKNPRDAAFETITTAESFEQWQQSALQLDDLIQADLWRQNAASKYYDYRLINERRRAIIQAREDGDVLGLVNLLRSGLVRNLGNITTPRLFSRAYAGTKLLIEEYVTQVAFAVEYVTDFPTSQPFEPAWTSQAKLDLLHDTRQAFGRSTLVLQGGAIFGLCHLGVVKALHLRGLLPRIITGTATGALIAALVGIHTEDELLDFLNGDGIDLTAFTRTRRHAKRSQERSLLSDAGHSYLQTLIRRVTRFVREGYFLDVNVLEECVKANVGELTFEEAYARTKRVLNITVATSGRAGIPNLLNYLTAPNVVSLPCASIRYLRLTDHTAHLVGRTRLECVIDHSILSSDTVVQRRDRRHRPVGLYPGCQASLIPSGELH